MTELVKNNNPVKNNKPLSVTVTETAATYFKKELQKDNTKTKIRFGVKDSGCNAKKYVIQLTDTKLDNDTVFHTHDLDILVTKSDLLYLVGTEIDYVREGINKIVKYNNPNVTTACGCGESFDIK